MPLKSWFRPKPSNMLGIDIQSSTITVLGVSYEPDKILVQGYDTVSLPNDNPNTFPNSEDIAFCIQKAITNAHLQGKLATVAISDTEVVSKIFSFSQSLTESEIVAFIKMEVASNSPFPQEFINWDFKILGPSEIDPDLQDIQVVVCKSEAINARITVIQKAGLEIHAVDLESFALERYRQWLIKTSASLDKPPRLHFVAQDKSMNSVNKSPGVIAPFNPNLPSIGIACGLALRRPG